MDIYKITKEYKWEMGHRLQKHTGKCYSLHGHSYKMDISISGVLNKDGMVIDFYDLDNIVNPFLEQFDHAFLCHTNDVELLDALKKLNSKYYLIEFNSTVENLSKYFCDYISQSLKSSNKNTNLKAISIRIFETEDSSAEYSMEHQ